MNSPQEIIQQALRQAEDNALNQLQPDHKQAYQQLKQIITTNGTANLSEEHKTYFEQMDQYVQQHRKQALDNLCQHDPQIMAYCREAEQRKQQAQHQQTQAVIDFSSQEYHQQLRTYVDELNASNITQLEYKLKTLYLSLVSKNYTRQTALQHIRYVLQALEQTATSTGNSMRQQEVQQLWNQIQQINQPAQTILYDLWDTKPIPAFDTQDDDDNIVDGQYIKSIPMSYPDDVITYMVLPTKAQLHLATKLRSGIKIPDQIYLKRRKGRPNKDTSGSHEYYTPVMISGNIDSEVIQFFSEEPDLEADILRLVEQINQSRDFYMRSENRHQQQPYMQMQPTYGQVSYSYGSSNIYGTGRPRRIGENSFDDYGESDHNFTESSEFEEEDITEEEEEQLNITDDESEGDAIEEVEDENKEDSSSGQDLEDIEQDIENVIDEVLDLKIIPFEDCWKYPPSFMVRPEPDDVWKFDQFRPKTQPTIPRSDAGFILERVKYLEEDLDTYQASDSGQKQDEPIVPEQSRVYIFLIKWRGCSHIHTTWELEANIVHLTSYVKVKKFKHQFIDRQSILACERVAQAQKDNVLDQIEEIRRNQKLYLIPEKIVAFRNAEDKQTSWDTSLQKIISTVRQKTTIESDGFDGSFVSGIADNQMHYYNQYSFNEVDDNGLIVGTPHAGVDKFKGYMYLIKWTDLPYQECTWELHEDLIACKFIGDDMMKELRKNYRNAGRAIHQLLSQPDHCKFGTRKQYIEFSDARPDFLIDVNDKFTLRPHQIRGINTLMHNWCHNRNMILCDPANSGKQVQAIAFMSQLYHQQKVPGPFFVVSPISKVASWQEQIANLFPDATLVSLLGSKEDRRLIIENELIADGIHRFHILLTTPSVALVEEAQLKKFKWRLMCIDDAHKLREREGKRSRVFTEFTTDAKLLLTATPLSNQVTEFYSLLHFIDPDQFHTQDIFTKLGQLDQFREAVKKCEIRTEDGEKQLMKQQVVPLQQIKQQAQTIDNTADDVLVSHNNQMIISSDEESNDMPVGTAPNQLSATYAGAALMGGSAESSEDRINNIVHIIRPYLLVRDQTMVSAKTYENDEKVLRVNMTEMQQRLSMQILDLNQVVLKYMQNEPSRLQNVICQLRKVCNHPYMFKSNLIGTMTINEIVDNSGKFQLIDALLSQFNDGRSKVLIFTQKQHTYSILGRYLQLKGYSYQQLMGSQTWETQARMIGQFNRRDSQDFVFLYIGKPLQKGIQLQTVDKVFIVDTDFNANIDLQLLGLNNQNSRVIEVFRFVTTNSIEEQIIRVAQKKLIIDYGLIRSSTEGVAGDTSVLRHVLEYGCASIVQGRATSTIDPAQSIASAQPFKYQHVSEAERLELKEQQFQDFKGFSDDFWGNYFADTVEESVAEVPYSGSLTADQVSQVYARTVVCGGSARASMLCVDGLSAGNVASVMSQLIRAAKQAASEFGVDVFSLPETLDLTFLGQKLDAVPVLRAWLHMQLLNEHVKNDRFRMPRSYFEIADFACAWGYIHDVRLLFTAKQNGLVVAEYTEEQVEKITCDAHVTVPDCRIALQQRLGRLLDRLATMPVPGNFIERLNEEGLRTSMQFEVVNEQVLDDKESELVRRFESSNCQFPIVRDQSRTTFTIELQQKIFKQSLQQLQKFFNADRRERINNIITRFYDASRTKLHYDDLRGISVLCGAPRLKKRVISQYERFDSSEADDNLLFKLYIQILNIVYSKTALITQQCDEHVLQLKKRYGAFQEMDNDTLVQEYVRDLFDYLYRQVWPICNVNLLPTPFVLAKMCEYNAAAFDEEDFECGVDGEEVYVVLRKERGTKTEAEDDNDADGNVNLDESY